MWHVAPKREPDWRALEALVRIESTVAQSDSAACTGARTVSVGIGPRSCSTPVNATTHAPQTVTARLASAAERLPPSRASIESGDRLGRYLILEPLASGGMGSVFIARDPDLCRNVAIKCLKFTCRNPVDERRARARLQIEAQAMAKLNHPNVVAVYDVGTLPSGDVFIASELVEGKTLHEWLRRSDHGSASILANFVAAGRGLAAAHEAGLVHRDFKPANVVVGDDGRVRVLDFGLAVGRGTGSMRSETLDSTDSQVAPTGEVLTLAGTVVGTPPYMAPEQHLGRKVDARTDQFAFCVSLWRALFSEHPFPRRNGRSWTYSIVHGPAPTAPRVQPGIKAVPKAVVQALLKGLEREPSARWPTMSALLERLERPHRRRWFVPTVVASMGVLPLVVFTSNDEDGRCSDAEARLSQVWNDQRRNQVEAAFARTNVAYASTASTAILERLDEHARQWLDTRRTSCEALSRPEDHAPITSCLERRLGALDSLHHVLRSADASTVENASALAERLKPVHHCLDEGSDDRSGLSPHQLDRLDALERALTRLELVETADRWRDGIARARLLLSRSERLGYEPTIARAHVRLAGMLARAGDYEDSVEHLELAALAAERSGADALAVEAKVRLVDVLSIRLARPSDARNWLHSAEASLARVGDDPRLRSHLFESRARFYYAQGDYAEAHTWFDRALELEHRLSPRSRREGELTNSCGVLAMWRGDLARADELFDEAYAIHVQTLGPGHPATSNVVGNQAILLEQEGDVEGALELYRKENELKIAALGPRHERVGRSHYNVSGILSRLRRYEEAIGMQEQALSIFEERLGSDHPLVGQSLTKLGALRRVVGEDEAALADLGRGLAIVEASLGPDHRDTANVRHSYAITLGALGRLEEALEQLDLAMPVLEKGRNEPTELPRARLYLAQVLATLGDTERALQEAKRCLDEVEATQAEVGIEPREVLDLIAQLEL